MNVISKSRVLALVSAAVILSAALPAATNLVVNPGFETGDFTGWTVSGNPQFLNVNQESPHTGSFGVFAGPQFELASITQAIPTIAGQTYQLDYWLTNLSGLPTNAFQASWNGQVVSSLTNASTFGYTLFSFPSLTATSASTTLQFDFRHDPFFWGFDDVSVQLVSTPGGPTSGVPDSGSTVALLGLALSALAFFRRRLA
jgi:hypothetical protein